MSKRSKISLADTQMDIVQKMTEGNPGALTVVMEILKKDKDFGLLNLLHFDDMNMRGSQIWVAYKDWAGCDLEKLMQAARDRNVAMVDAVNKVCVAYGHRAVTGGFS